MIDVQQITKRYGQHTAIDRVTFSVAKGEVLAFLGPNGAGKTTTMRILTCFMPPTEGRATVAGYDCLEQSMDVKRRIGYLPETPPVYQELTVDEYLRFVGRLRGLAGAMLTAAMSREIERLGLGSVQHRLIGNLSRGYRQRVGLAQALIHDPARADFRRADRRPRPETDHRDPGIDQKPSRIAFRDLEHSHSSRKPPRSANASSSLAAGALSPRTPLTDCPPDCAIRKRSP